MIKAYVLLKCYSPSSVVSSLTDLIAETRKVKGVNQAHILLGPESGIAYIEVEDYEELVKTLGGLLNIEGIDKVDTRIALPQY